ncbi:hypothetical protein Pcinc_009953 [Petrolisthes cinctipes]|uniref:Uncharacterized protein n=1 Tax=Petrolisthes cinctipes TaxID=88211 RepID=A0AAE1G5R6_PETCI|nr:hypothetical protein Pcinc_009953 [Petrolisthes cinctipes]
MRDKEEVERMKWEEVERMKWEEVERMGVGERGGKKEVKEVMGEGKKEVKEVMGEGRRKVASFYFLLSRLEGLKGRLDSTEAMEGRQESMLSRELLWLKSQVKDIKEEWRSRARDGTAEDTCTPLGCKQTQPTTP